MHAERNAARLLLRTLDDPTLLLQNPLLDRYAECGHDERRAAVLRALDALDPGALQGRQAERRRRKHAIVVRCDVYGEAQDQVARDLGLSMRQFFRERSEAFEEFVGALKVKPAVRRARAALADVFAVRERFIQKLRSCGQHERVWEEACAFAAELGADERAIEFWSVAAEGARYMGDLVKSAEAIAMAKRVRESAGARRPVASDILITIPEIALDWTSGCYVGASKRLDDAMQRHRFGKALVDLDATLFGIMLTYGIPIEIERGRWDRARLLLRHLQEVGGRIDERHTFPSQRRHSGRVALRGQHDGERAIVDLREALAVAQRFDNLAAEASAATDLGIALAERSAAEAQRYIAYGLTAGRKILGRNEYAMLALGALPAICRCAGPHAALEQLDSIASGPPLAQRAQMAFDLAELALLLEQRRYGAVAERAIPLAKVLESRGLVAPAGEATLIAAAAHTAKGRRSVARRLLKESSELVRACGEIAWPSVSAFGTNLAVATT